VALLRRAADDGRADVHSLCHPPVRLLLPVRSGNDGAELRAGELIAMPTQVFLDIFFVLLALGMPIYLVLGTTAGSLFLISGQPLMGVAQKILDELNSTLLLAVPFFVMAAVFMQKGGIAKALIDFAAAWMGWVRGGLAVVCVFA